MYCQCAALKKSLSWWTQNLICATEGDGVEPLIRAEQLAIDDECKNKEAAKERRQNTGQDKRLKRCVESEIANV